MCKQVDCAMSDYLSNQMQTNDGEKWQYVNVYEVRVCKSSIAKSLTYFLCER